MKKRQKLTLSTKKQERVDKRKPSVVRGKILNYNAAVQARYERELVRLVVQMSRQTRREVERLFKQTDVKEYFGEDASPAAQARIVTNALNKKFNDLFGRRAPDLATRMVNGSEKASAASLAESFKQLSGGLNINTSIATSGIKQVVSASITENVGLIKSIAQKYLTDVQGAVLRSITMGNGLADLVPALEKYEGITVRRATNIAYDQTRKVFNNINKGRMEKAGVKRFEWLHTGGSQHPRPLHVGYDGQIFSFDDLPVIVEDTGERGIPGQAINCRCRMIPVIEFDKEDSEDEQ